MGQAGHMVLLLQVILLSIVSYAIGNIQTLRRRGVDDVCDNGAPDPFYEFTQIDNLKYTYANNRLNTVTEGSNPNRGFKGTGGTVYSYDGNGNMTSDPNKGMDARYNHLNLPYTIEINDNYINFTYDAAGTKLKKHSTGQEDGEQVDNTSDYIGGIEYKNGTIEAIYHAEGRVVYKRDEDSGTIRLVPEYYLKDHLGNVRVVFSDLNENGYLEPFAFDPAWPILSDPMSYEPSELLQENHYYPFGMEMEGAWELSVSAPENKYTYGGKEMQSDFGLDLLDYGARFYDPAIGRFTSLDPLADKMVSWSPYNYTFNNPIRFVDPDGRAPKPPDDFIVNESGEVVEIISTNDPHRILTESGEVLYSNDPSTDQQEMDLYDVGFQMVQFIDDDLIENIMAVRKAGSGEGNLLTNSYGKFDFVWSELKVSYTNDLMKESERRRGVGLGRGGYIENGGFYVFGDKSEHGDRRKVYNMHDAGNFLWGNANRREGHSAKKLLWGANLNELFNFRWGDSNADMQAILDGYYH